MPRRDNNTILLKVNAVVKGMCSTYIKNKSASESTEELHTYVTWCDSRHCPSKVDLNWGWCLKSECADDGSGRSESFRDENFWEASSKRKQLKLRKVDDIESLDIKRRLRRNSRGWKKTSITRMGGLKTSSKNGVGLTVQGTHKLRHKFVERKYLNTTQVFIYLQSNSKLWAKNTILIKSIWTFKLRQF